MKLLPHRCLSGPAIALFFAAMACPAALLADVFVLENGGRVSGTWLNRQESPRNTFVVQTRGGGKIVLDRAQVAQVVSQTPAEVEYEKIRPEYPDTVDGHWRLAEWCLKHRLTEHRQTHLRRILQLDPEHPKARNLLGYRKIGGKWMTRAEEMERRGMKYYQGKYRTSQEIVLLERDQKQKSANIQWLKKLKRWRGWLATNHPAKIDQARKNILAIRDPYATSAVVQYLRKEDYREVKLLYLKALSQIATPSAIKALVEESLGDADEEIRLSCLDYLMPTKHPEILGLYVKALRSKQNSRVNRAAVALKRLGDPEAISPLIDSLVTVHKHKVGGGNAGQIGASFPTSGGGGGGLSLGGKGPIVVKQVLRNPDVLDALVKLSGGANFGYDLKTWKHWYSAQQKLENIQARRD